MRTIKALGLGLLAAIAAMAVMGAATASGSTKTVTLCKVKELVCPEPSQYPAGTVIHAKLKTGTNAVLSGSLTVSCSASTVLLETLNKLDTTLLAKVTGLTFTNCSTCPTVTALVGSFGEAHLKNSGGLKGLLTILSPLVHLEGCFGFAKCTVSAGAVELDADTSVEPAVVKAVNEKLSVSGFGCGSEGQWNAEYVLTAPTPLYIES